MTRDGLVGLATLLERHIPFEEDVVFPEVERVDADALDAAARS